MATYINSLCITSYNSTGFGLGAQSHMKTLLSFSDILCVQEHFLLDSRSKKNSNTDKLKNQFSGAHDMFIVPAAKSNDNISKGRGKGGLALIWKKNLTKFITKIPSDNFRLQAVKFSIPDSEFLLVNAYFPCDPRSDNFDDTELLNLLASLEQLISQANCQNVLFAADLNCHFDRGTHFTNLVSNCLSDLNLSILWQQPDYSVDYTFCNIQNDVATFSTLDHFSISPRLLTAVGDAGVIHSGENMSNHSAIFIKIEIGTLGLELDNAVYVPRSSWSNATEDAKYAYKESLASRLNNLPLYSCISCHDLNCSDPAHLQGIESYTLELLEAMENAGNQCLPLTNKSKSGPKSIPGWREHIKPYADDSKFWYSVWLSAGKPLEGNLYLNMRQSRKQFKFAVRRLKRCSAKIRNEKLANALLNSDGNIFTEIKKLRGKSTNFSSRIDNKVGVHDIANHFATTYDSLYNKITLDDKFESVRNKVLEKVNEASLGQYHRITEAVVAKAINLLKPRKNDSIHNISSEFYIHGPSELVQHVTNILKLFFSHGFIPKTVLACTLIPLIKDNLGDSTSSSNYRAIAGGCLLLKLIDLVIVILEGDKLDYDTMQFAYQAKSSTTMCSWTVTAVIDHFNERGSSVFGASMDMSKAFDMVDWCELFTTLMERQVDALFLRLVLYIYSNQYCNVKWNGTYSRSFSVQNGVRQGAVSSGIFFAIYIDKLLQLLRKTGLGCHIHGVFYGALIYADDIILLSASRNGLQAMVNVCHEFALSRNLKFGTHKDASKSKTKCILFTKKKYNTESIKKISLGGDPLPWVRDVKHLGHVLQSDNSMRLDIALKRGSYIGKVNSLLQEFGNVPPQVLMKLINSFAASIYGSNLWDIFSKDSERLYTSYNVTIRNALNLDKRTHRYLLEPLAETVHLKTMILSRYVSFFKSLIKCRKFPVRFLARVQQFDMRTVLGKTLRKLTELCDVAVCDLNTSIVKKKIKYKSIPDEEKWRIWMAKELMDVRTQDQVVDGFSVDETNEILAYICSS